MRDNRNTDDEDNNIIDRGVQQQPQPILDHYVVTTLFRSYIHKMTA